MRRRFALAAMLFLTRMPVAGAANAAFTQMTLTYHGAPMPVGIWYPTGAPTAPQTLKLLDQEVAQDAPPAPGAHPLVVITHGNGGTLASHVDTALALARAGFVVAAPQHVGDNYRDHADELHLWTRPPQVSAVIDAMLHDWTYRSTIDPGRIGIFGFSAGGFTALVAIGGRPDYGLIGPYCTRHAAAFVCGLIRAHGIAHPTPPPDTVWMSDPRIRAAVIAAPALGFTFGEAGLAHVTVPVQLWGAEDDDVLPVADNAGAVRAHLPHPPEFHLVPGAVHVDFLSPCTPALAAAAPQICVERGRFDRTAFHAGFDASVVRFFARQLGR